MIFENEFEKNEKEEFFNTLLYYDGTYYDNENLIEKVN